MICMAPRVIRKRRSSIATAWLVASSSRRWIGPARRSWNTCRSFNSVAPPQTAQELCVPDNASALGQPLGEQVGLAAQGQCRKLLFRDRLRQKALFHLRHNYIIGIDHLVQMDFPDF